MILLFLFFLLTSETKAFSKIDFNKTDTKFDSSYFRKYYPQEARITNGQAATAKQFPYQVGLRLSDKNGGYWCGGTLLSDRWILTAAHCTKAATEIKVILGSLRSKPTGETGEVALTIPGNSKTVFVHKRYSSNSIVNDISLIRLPEAVTLTDYIKPASLPRFTGNAPSYSGKTGVISGWGVTSDSSSHTSSTLQWTDAPIISNTQCASYFGNRPSSQICVSTRGTHKSTCNGDSGGPLVIKGTDTVVGVTSFGSSSGCEKGYPAVFTRVTSFLGWIKEISGLTP